MKYNTVCDLNISAAVLHLQYNTGHMLTSSCRYDACLQNCNP